MRRLLAPLMLLLLTACTSTTAPQTPESIVATAFFTPSRSEAPQWSRDLFTLGECRAGSTWKDYTTEQVASADVTGDAVADHVVVGRCPALTSAWPWDLYVIDGSTRFASRLQPNPMELEAEGPSGKPIRTLGGLMTISVKVLPGSRQPVVRATGKSHSDWAGFCCPDLELEQTWAWSGFAFELVKLRAEPLEGYVARSD